MSIHEENNKKSIGKKLDVLCEGYDAAAGIYYGRSYADAPDIDGKVYFSSKTKVRQGEFVKVKINEVMEYDLIGENISNEFAK